jgi:hypothetical protein
LELQYLREGNVGVLDQVEKLRERERENRLCFSLLGASLGRVDLIPGSSLSLIFGYWQP